jgi:hypothetical protein
MYKMFLFLSEFCSQITVFFYIKNKNKNKKIQSFWLEIFCAIGRYKGFKNK